VLCAVLDGPAQNSQEAGVFGEVVGLDAEEAVQLGDDLAF